MIPLGHTRAVGTPSWVTRACKIQKRPSIFQANLCSS